MYIASTHIGRMCIYMYVPGSFSSIVMAAWLGQPIVARSVWLVELITTMKFSDSSVVLSSMVDTIKMADASPAVNVTVYGPAS